MIISEFRISVDSILLKILNGNGYPSHMSTYSRRWKIFNTSHGTIPEWKWIFLHMNKINALNQLQIFNSLGYSSILSTGLFRYLDMYHVVIQFMDIVTSLWRTYMYFGLTKTSAIYSSRMRDGPSYGRNSERRNTDRHSIKINPYRDSLRYSVNISIYAGP